MKHQLEYAVKQHEQVHADEQAESELDGKILSGIDQLHKLVASLKVPKSIAELAALKDTLLKLEESFSLSGDYAVENRDLLRDAKEEIATLKESVADHGRMIANFRWLTLHATLLSLEGCLLHQIVIVEKLPVEWGSAKGKEYVPSLVCLKKWYDATNDANPTKIKVRDILAERLGIPLDADPSARDKFPSFSSTSDCLEEARGGVGASRGRNQGGDRGIHRVLYP